MNEIIRVIFQIITAVLSLIGILCCIYYILCKTGSKNKKDLYIKGGAYLILDTAQIGDKLEYYVRRIQNDIKSRYIYISRIILYSKSPSQNTNEETLRLCRILAKDYGNIVFLDDIEQLGLKSDILEN